MKKWLLLAILLQFGGLLKAETLPFNEFRGLNSDDSPLSLQGGQTPDSENVVTDEGPGLQGRKGYVAYSTVTAEALWEFPLSNGTRYLISKSSANLVASTGDGAFSVTIATIPTDRITVAAVLGDRFYFANTLNGLQYWNGTAVLTGDATMTVDKLVTHKGRLWAAGKPGTERIIYGSKYLDGTNWALAVNPTEDDPVQITVAGALDENIQGLFSSFQDKLVWFKKNSFGAIFGSRRTNFTQRTFSDTIGVSSAESIQDCDDRLRWLGPDRTVWEFDGTNYKKISENIDGILGTVIQGDANTRSTTLTSQADFAAGTDSPTGSMDSSVLPGSLTPKTTSFADTSAADFGGGTDSPTGYTYSAIDGTVSLGTATALASFSDTLTADFNGGTGSNVTVANDAVALTVGAETSQVHVTAITDTFASINFGAGTTGVQQQFLAPNTVSVTKVIARLSYTSNSTLGTGKIGIYTDVSNAPGTLLGEGTFNPNGRVGGATYDELVTLANPGSTGLIAGSTYWARITCQDCTTGEIRIFGESSAAPYTLRSKSNTSAVTTDRNFNFNIYGSSYPAAGNIVSRTFDVGFTTASWLWGWDAFTVDDTVPARAGIAYQTQTSADGSNWDSLTSVTSGSASTSTVRRYIRYKATLTGDGGVTPTLRAVTLAMTPRSRPSAVFTSRAFDTGFPSTVWGLVAMSSTASNGGTVTTYTQSSANGSDWDSRLLATNGEIAPSATNRYLRYQVDLVATSSASTAAVQDFAITGKPTGTYTTTAINVGGNITAWSPVTINDDTTSGGAITYEFSASDTPTFSVWNSITKTGTPGVAVKPYAAIRATYDITVATQAPALNDITMAWTEGSTLRATSGYYNQRYWLGVAISSTANNKVLVYDKENEWQRYSIGADAMVIYNSRLYFGGANGIFLAESTYADNGAPITSYYRTPTVAPARIDLYNTYDALWMTTDSSDATLATSFQINGIPTDYAMGSVAMNATTGIQNFKLPFSVSEVQAGKYINFKWSAVGTSFWRVMNGTLFYQPSLLPE